MVQEVYTDKAMTSFHGFVIHFPGWITALRSWNSILLLSAQIKLNYWPRQSKTAYPLNAQERGKMKIDNQLVN